MPPSANSIAGDRQGAPHDSTLKVPLVQISGPLALYLARGKFQVEVRAKLSEEMSPGSTEGVLH